MIVEIIVVGIFVIVGIIWLQFEHHTRKYKAVAIVIIGFLIYFSVVGLFSSDKVELDSPRGVVNAVYFYFGWIGETSVKLWDIGTDTVNMVGNAIKVNNSEDKNSRRR